MPIDDSLGYLEIEREATAEIIEKKSRFIATIRPVYSEEEANAFIEEMKKKYWDARHNCSAFVIGKDGRLVRASDDGEPAQTAGKPMLEVLVQEEIKNVCVVVTRYFGGTLLGTGGLVRAYQAAVKEALLQAQILHYRRGSVFQVQLNYHEYGKLQYFCNQQNYSILQTDFLEEVTVVICTPFEKGELFQKDLTSLTNGKAEIILLEHRDYIDKGCKE